MVQYMNIPSSKDPMEEEFFISFAPEDGYRTCIRIIVVFSITN
jgi:hypothetical protein